MLAIVHDLFHMSAALAPPPDSAAPAPDPAEERARAFRERQIERLDRMAEAGMEMIEALVAQAKGSGLQVVDGDVGLAFSRVSRAVRMAVLLQEQLIEGPGAGKAANAANEPQKIIYGWINEWDERELGRRERVGQIVEDIAEKAHGDAEAAERLGREAAERLERDDIYGDVLERPVSEVVADICRDLGLDPDWDGLFARPWARNEIAGGDIGAPLAAVMARMRRETG
jgi:hypothetical protein